MITNMQGLASQKQTYLNILYLLVSFPLGITYFVFLVAGISIGISTVIIWIGVPITLFTMVAWRYLGTFERSYTISWLHVEIAPIFLKTNTKKNLWQRIRTLFSSSMTWKTLAYLFLKFPFGILAFVLTITIPFIVLTFSIISLIIGLFVAPVLYMIVLLSGKAIDIRAIIAAILNVLLVVASFGITLVAVVLMIPGKASFHLINGGSGFLEILLGLSSRLVLLGGLVGVVVLISFMFQAVSSLSLQVRQEEKPATTLKQLLFFSLTGCGLVLAPLYLLNGLAWLWGQFACVMLGMSNNAIRLAQAQTHAAQEHARAERAEQSRRELIVNVSHELRTPIASIRGHVESLLMTYDEDKEQAPSPEAIHNYLSIVYREATHLGTLVDDLLALARTEANELRLHITEVDAAEVLEEVYQTLMPLARRERQITLIRTIATELPAVKADRQRLLQVLLNLVRNAISYTPDGGIVSIALACADEHYLVLSVADTGIGISAEDLEHVFERFYRADASRTRSSGGSGLGLAIVRDFVTAMGGSVSVESVVGEGSRFYVRLCIA